MKLKPRAEFSGGGATSNSGIATVSATYGKYASKSVEELNAEYGEGNWIAINNRAELEAIAYGNASVGKIYVLMSDIDLAGKEWEPIGGAAGFRNFTNSFKGTFDGNGHVISNMTINKLTEDDASIGVGFFGATSGAVIKDFHLENVNVTAYEYVGGLAGQMGNTKVENSSVTGVITSTYDDGNNASKGYVGGITGWLYSGGSIKTSFADVDVFGSRTLGGLVGDTENKSSIENSYALGDVTGKWVVTGLSFCENNGSITNSYSVGGLSGVSSVYGLTNKTATATSSFFDKENAGRNNGAGTGLTTAEMQDINTYLNAGWDISAYDEENSPTTTWFIKDGEYPQLAWEWEPVSAPEPEPEPEPEPTPPTPTPIEPEPTPVLLDSVDFQIGANSGENNTLNVDPGFSLNGFKGDVTTIESASDTLNAVDELKKTLNEKRSEIGVSRNRIDGIIESQSIKIENLSASHSTIVDTDFAQESATLVRSQILQQATSSLLKQANITQQLALQLLQ